MHVSGSRRPAWAAFAFTFIHFVVVNSYPFGAGSCSGPGGRHGPGKAGNGGFELTASSYTVVGGGVVSFAVVGTVPMNGILMAAAGGEWAGGDAAALPAGLQFKDCNGPRSALTHSTLLSRTTLTVPLTVPDDSGPIWVECWIVKTLSFWYHLAPTAVIQVVDAGTVAAVTFAYSQSADVFLAAGGIPSLKAAIGGIRGATGAVVTASPALAPRTSGVVINITVTVGVTFPAAGTVAPGSWDPIYFYAAISESRGLSGAFAGGIVSAATLVLDSASSGLAPPTPLAPLAPIAPLPSPTSGCPPSPLPSFACVVAVVPGVELHWAVAGTTVSLAAVFDSVPGDAWVALAVAGTPGTMFPADAVIAVPGAPPSPFAVDGYDAGDVRPDSRQSLLTASVERTPAGRVTLAFSRLLVNGGREAIVPSAGSVPFNWAVGHGPTLAAGHGTRKGSFAVDLSSGVETSFDDDTAGRLIAARRAHGALMIIAWAVCLPSGVAIAWGGKHHDPLWFHLHRGLNLLGLAVSFGAWVTAVALFRGNYAHGTIGSIVMFAAFAQALNAFCRPHKNAPWRWAWEVLHHWCGRLVLLLAACNLVLGVLTINVAQGDSIAAFAVPAALLLATTAIGMPILLWLHAASAQYGHEPLDGDAPTAGGRVGENWGGEQRGLEGKGLLRIGSSTAAPRAGEIDLVEDRGARGRASSYN